MVLKKREKYLVITAAVGLAILVLNSLVISPYFDSYAATSEQDAKDLKAIADGKSMIDRQKKLAHDWEQLMQSLPVSASVAESQTLHAITDWCQWAGVNLISSRPERRTQEGPFQVIGLEVTATGNMAAVSRYIWALEKSPIPLRINQLKLNSRKEGIDDLLMTISLSTMCLSEAQPKPAGNATAAAATSGEQP